MKFLRNSFLVLALTAATALTPVAAKENRTAPHDTEHTTDFPQLTLANWAPRLRNYLKKNYRFAIKRLARDLITNKINKNYTKSGNAFQDEFAGGAVYSTVAATLDSIMTTDEEDWVVAVLLAGLVSYWDNDQEIDMALAAALHHYVNNYLLESPLAQRMGRDAVLLHLVPFFTESLENEPRLRFSFARGLANKLSYFATWNDKTAVPFGTIFGKGSFGEHFATNMLGVALIPALVAHLQQKRMIPA